MGNAKSPKKKEEHALREWVSDNLRYILLIALIVVIVAVVFIAVRAFSGGHEEAAESSAEIRTASVSSETESRTGSESASHQAAPSAAPTQTPKPTKTATPSPTATAAPEPSPSAEPESAGVPAETQLTVSDIVARYFEALASGDVQQAEAVVETLDDEDRAAIAGHSFAQNYENFRFLTYPADTEGSYVVFAAYDYQYPGFSAKLPALTELYVFTRPDGSMCIASEATENEKAAVLQQALENEEVQALLAESRQKYEEVLLSNPELSAYIQSQFEG